MAELPLDERGTLAPAKVRHRILVGDVAINHIVDGRVHFVDADTGRYLGLVSAADFDAWVRPELMLGPATD